MAHPSWRDVESALVRAARAHSYRVSTDEASGDKIIREVIDIPLNLTEFAKDLAKELR